MSNPSTRKKLLTGMGLLILMSLVACTETENFYDTLRALPQLDLRQGNAYSAAYAVNDTMVVVGKLQPENNLVITVGGVAATILTTERVLADPLPDADTLDRVSFIITGNMGAGAGRPVVITTGGYSLNGPSIEIYETAGAGSFSQPLRLTEYFAGVKTNALYLNGVNGSGNIYYYADKAFYRLKEGMAEAIVTPGQMRHTDGKLFTVASVFAGAVDPQEENIYFSAFTSKGYLLCKFNIALGALEVLNTSSRISEPPYEGILADLKFVCNGIYPDNDGNLYLAMSSASASALPYALAYYHRADNMVKYQVKLPIADDGQEQYKAGIPGLQILDLVPGERYAFYRVMLPDNSLYVFTTVMDGSATGLCRIKRYDLTTKTVTSAVTVGGDRARQENLQAVGPFHILNFAFDFHVGAQGFVPLPGQRLAVWFHYHTDNIKPFWGAIDFAAQRLYRLAPRVETTPYTISNELLNYDADGHLYMTANTQTVVVKMEIIPTAN